MDYHISPFLTRKNENYFLLIINGGIPIYNLKKIILLLLNPFSFIKTEKKSILNKSFICKSILSQKNKIKKSKPLLKVFLNYENIFHLQITK